MRRQTLPLSTALLALLVASCTDQPTGEVDTSAPIDYPAPSLDLVDANHGDGGNPHFFWLPKLAKSQKFTGTADPALFPVVEICVRNETEDGCLDSAPLLASFERPAETGGSKKPKSGKSKKGTIKVNKSGKYSVGWRLKDFPPEVNTAYRIRVLIQGSELGHADIVAVKKSGKGAKSAKIGGAGPDGELIEISSKGTFKIAFRLEEGVLQEQFCNDPTACNAGVEVAGDGLPTIIDLTTSDPGTTTQVTVITVNDAVFSDQNGTPVENVVVTAEIVGPPSEDVFTNDALELPFFVLINTIPEDVFIDPNSAGVEVVVCQDDAELANRGIDPSLHPQLIMYKVTDPKSGFPFGETKRVLSTFGAPECAGFVPAPAPSPGLVGFLRWGASRVLDFVKPTPLNAYFLHGGLNTRVTRSTGTLDAAFSTFSAALGPNADSSLAIVPGGVSNDTTNILIQLTDAVGENFQLGGDTLDVSIVAGPSTGAPVTVIDELNGMHTAKYVPVAQGIDSIQILLTTAEGFAQGAIAGSPYASVVACGTPASQTTVTVTLGADCSTPGKVPTMELAMDIVAPGGTILMDNGIHVVEELVVVKPVTIDEVTGASAAIHNNTALRSLRIGGVPSGTVTVRNIDFVNNSPGINTGGNRTSSIEANGAYDQVVIEDNTFTNTSPDANAGVRADTTSVSGATVLIQRNTFTGGRAGFVSTGVDEAGGPPPNTYNPFVTLDDNDFADHLVRGAQLQVFSDGSTTNNDMVRCGGACIQYQNASNGTISTNRVADCGPAGCIRVFGGLVDVLSNHIEDATPEPVPTAGFHNAIRFSSGAVGKVNGNDIDGCGWGVCIQVAFSAIAEVRDNTIVANVADHTESGIIGYGGDDPVLANNSPPTLTVTGNVITGVGTGPGTRNDDDSYAFFISGIMMRNATATEISDNQITNAARGIHIFQNGTISAGVDNTSTLNRIAVSSFGGGVISMVDNDFTDWITAIQDGDDSLTGSIKCNWWGTTAGPVGAVSASISPSFFAPWASGPVAGPATASCLPQAGVFLWHPDSGGNDHYYEFVNVGSVVPWTTAKAAAEARTAYGVSGHLVTLTSAAEQGFVNSIQTDSLSLPGWRPWIGLTDEVTEGDYLWVTGEPFSFTNWSVGEPNNVAGVENYVEMFASGVWNDAPNVHTFTKSYLVEYEVAAAPPAPSPSLISGLRPVFLGGSGGAEDPRKGNEDPGSVN
jgi:Lectin C-type domain/Right handed beta helix region